MAVLSITSLPDVLFDLRIAEGTLLLALLCSAPLLRGKPPQPASTNGHSESAEVIRIVEVPRRQAITLLLSILALTAFLDGSVTVATVVFNQYPEITLDPWRGAGFYPVSLLVAFAGLAVVSEIKEARGVPIWQSKLLKLFVLIALTFDVALAVLIPLTVPIWKIRENLNPHVPETPSPVLPVGPAPAVHFGLAVLRTLVLLVLFPILFSTRKTYEPVGHSGSTQQNGETSLLIPATTTATAGTSASVSVPKAAYGTFDPASSTSPQIKTATPIPAVGTSTTDKSANGELSWMEVGSRLRRLSPYLWPSKNVGLQLLAVVCFAILGAGRAVSAAIPFKLSDAIGALSQNDARIAVPAILWYVGLKALQGSGGLATLRNFLWTPVMQYTNRSMSQLAFDHLLNLSLAWHTRRKTGEVLRILDRGTAINQIVELIIFNVLATLADLAIALYIFFWYFGPVMSVLVATIMVTYVVVSTLLTSWWTKLRRSMNEADIAPRGIHTDCLLNYETVKYFGGEAHEGERYRQAISRYQRMEIKTIAGLNLMSLIQNLLLSTGLLIGSFMVVFDATYPHDQVVKRFVVFITYLAQLYGPLNSLAYIYRGINQSLVDTERLMDLLEEQPEVQDKPDAKDIIVTDGVIEFDNVTFSYDNRTTALNGVSFTIPKGGSMALVGESGSGKSTILRLLYRFYDLAPGNGAIRIDGQDIRDVTQASLREAIGVVPQDSVLFNNTIAYNIGYGKFGALGDEIESAARAAQMHERIMSFPDGYETAVGERGIRLSGGEKQRVAIARTILKAPQVILLDEATSALDTTTEREIQKALQNLVHGRSSLSIAHRLSTILNSDLILVLHQGEIIESGSYRELVERDGRFAAMWAEQISSGDNTHAPSDTPRNEIPVGSTSQAHIVPIPVNVSDGPGFVAAESVAASPGSPAPGSQIAPAEQLVPVTVRSEITVPNESEQQVADGASLAEVRPDVFVASGSVVSMAHDSSKAAEESSTVNPETASPTSRQLEPTPATNPLPLPKSNDAHSSVVSNRPDLREAIPSNSGTPSITVSPSPEPESDRLKQAAQRFRMASQGAAARSGQSIARLARRVSPRSNRQADNGSHLDVTSTRKAGFLRWGSSTSVGQLSREDTEGQVVDSDKKKSKKDKRKGGD